MMLYTIMPIEDVLAPAPDPPSEPYPVPAFVAGVQVLVVPTPDGRAKIERLMSLDPKDYLDPRLVPGTITELPRQSHNPNP